MNESPTGLDRLHDIVLPPPIPWWPPAPGWYVVLGVLLLAGLAAAWWSWKRWRDGFTGPVQDHVARVPAVTVEVERPPGSEELGFLVTTESFKVEETWNPAPGRAPFGSVVTRTISQQADQVMGMALAPPPNAAPDGTRRYLESPAVATDTERGRFVGTRRDTVTFVLQRPGVVTFPPITYVWWNPKTRKLHGKTLPAAEFVVLAPVESLSNESSSTIGRTSIWWVAAGFIAVVFGMWQRRPIVALVDRWRRRWRSPERAAARRLIRACRRHDAMAAARAWNEWSARQSVVFAPPAPLHSAVLELHRHLFGPARPESWNGSKLKQAFLASLSREQPGFGRDVGAALPPLNPRDDVRITGGVQTPSSE